MKPKSTVSISLIHVLLNYAASIAIDSEEICRAAGFPMETLHNPDVRVSARQFYALWSRVVARAGDPDFGLHVAEPSHHQFGGDILTAVMLNCPTVGSAMEKLIRYHDLATDVVRVKLLQEEDQALYVWQSVLGDDNLDRQISEAIIGRIFFTIKMLSGGKMPISGIRFRHPRPGQIGEHQRIFGCPVVFGQSHDAVVVPLNSLDQPIPLANPRLLENLEAIAQGLLTSLARPDTWSEQVSQGISQLLLRGEKPALGSIARQLAVSARHLQNKLKAENQTYRVLLDRVRKEMALRYLKEDRINIYDTAFLLGFSDQSSFNHAFKRWTGMTPGEYRDNNPGNI